MISSLIWLTLVILGKIDYNYAPWGIYLPIAITEMLIYFILLFRWGGKK